MARVSREYARTLRYGSKTNRNIQVALSEEMIEDLEKIADSLRTSRTEIVRQALDEYLKKEKEVNPQIFEEYTFNSIEVDETEEYDFSDVVDLYKVD